MTMQIDSTKADRANMAALKCDETASVAAHPFGKLPIELRYKIYDLTLPQRVVMVRLRDPNKPASATDAELQEVGAHLTPYKPEYHEIVESLPISLSISSETRDYLLKHRFHEINAERFCDFLGSPFKLYCPAADFLYITDSLYMFRSNESTSMITAQAAKAQGTPRPFVLDFLATCRPDVAKVRFLAISHIDMHLETVQELLPSLEKWPALQELALYFYTSKVCDQRQTKETLKKHLKVTLVDVTDDEIKPFKKGAKDTYQDTLIELRKASVQMLNAELMAEAARRLRVNGVVWRAPKITIKLTRFAESNNNA